MRASSSSFALLHPKLQQWLWSKEWSSLRQAQELAIPPIVAAERDVIISASTAAGKTEAAFLPIATRLANDDVKRLGCLCVSPLKALINDQHTRLEQLFAAVDLDVHRWHGDVPGNKKLDLLKKPRGVLLITPESLEAIFILRGMGVRELFGSLRYVVVDELHAFMSTERGMQLQSLLHRIESAIERRVPRVGLSATLGDLSIAARFLRPRDAEAVLPIVSTEDTRELKIQVRGYKVVAPPASESVEDIAKREHDRGSYHLFDIAEHVFKTLRGTDNLVFANRRRDVEQLADLLRRKSEQLGVPNEFLPHHGSLSRALREEAEAFIKDTSKPGTLVCTTTLEMGIDIGSVTSIAQVGVPPSVASLRQRLGRSGRREGEPSVLRIYVAEPEITPKSTLVDRLRMSLVQSIAMVNLLLEGFCEVPSEGQLHLSTLVQQVLSCIAQHGGVFAPVLFERLCGSGPFGAVDEKMFATLLRALGEKELISQMHNGELVIGIAGEKLVNHYSFYTAFWTREEYTLLVGGQVLGSLPIDFPLVVDNFLIFAGRRWRILEVDAREKVVMLEPAHGGRVPEWSSGHSVVDDRVREEMFAVYCSNEVPVFLDKRGQELLAEARDEFERAQLRFSTVVESEGDALVFPWKGDRVLHTLELLLGGAGLSVTREDSALRIAERLRHDVEQALAAIAQHTTDVVALAGTVNNLEAEKHDAYVPRVLLVLDYARRDLRADAINFANAP